MNRRDDDPAEAVRTALDRLVRERIARKTGGHLIEARLRGADLRLPLPETGADGSFTRKLVARLVSPL